MDVIILSSYDSELQENSELMKALGQEDSAYKENKDYYADGGDFWIDSDKVKHDGLTLDFNWVAPYALLNFDPSQYSEHVELIGRWVQSLAYDGTDYGFDYNSFDNTWGKFEAAPSAIAYRGGSGYSYGIHVFTGKL